MNPFQVGNGLIMSEEQVKSFIRDIIVPLLINKDLTLSDASILSKIDILKIEMADVIEKTKIEKSFEWHSPFYIRVPKTCKHPITVEVDGLDASNRSISFGFKIPASYFNNDDNVPHIIYSNKYGIVYVKKIKYDKNIDGSTINNVFIIEAPEIGSGTISTRCLDSEVREYRQSDDVPSINFTGATKELKLGPDIDIEPIEHPEQLLRTRSEVDYIDFITTSMMITKEFANSLDPRTAYFTRDDNDADNLSFKFMTLAEAIQQIPVIYSRIPELWRNVQIEFDSSVTSISGLFEGVEHTDTVRSIIGPGITRANDLYKNSKIKNISPSLFSGMGSLQEINEAFLGTTNVKEAPKASDLFKNNPYINSARGLFEDSGIQTDPEYWKYINADFSGYVKKSLADPIAPAPYQGYALNRYYPATYDIHNLVFNDVTAFKTYLSTNRIDAYKSTDIVDPTDLSKFTITILEGNLDEMFKNSGVVKLPKTIEAPKAKSANEFASGVTSLIYTDTIGNIFTKCPKLESVVNAFKGCTGLTKGFELLGASDTINNYSGVFQDCTNIDWTTLPYPWRWNGQDGYPDNIVGIDGFKNIPNLANWVPKEWGGPGTETDPSVHTGSKTPIPIIASCYIGDDSFGLAFTDLRAGDLIEIALVDPDNRHTVLGKTKRVYATLSGVTMYFGISDISNDKHPILKDTDCIRVRVREQKRSPIKLWSDYIYQVPQVKLNPPAKTNSTASILGFITDGEV